MKNENQNQTKCQPHEATREPQMQRAHTTRVIGEREDRQTCVRDALHETTAGYVRQTHEPTSLLKEPIA